MFFLAWKRCHVSPTYTALTGTRDLMYMYNTFLSSTKWFLTPVLYFFNLPSRSESNTEEVLYSSSPELFRQPFKIRYDTVPRLSFSSCFLLSICSCVCSINLLAASLGYPFATNTSSMLWSSSVRCF